MRAAHSYPPIGSVSEGTLRTEDLADSFAWELRNLTKRRRLPRELRKRINTLLRDWRAINDMDEEHSSELVDEMIDALNELAAPYCYFGANEGDGACFGFWPIIDDELPRLPAGYDIPRAYWGEDVYLVNDHGNVDCGHVDKRGKFHEYWSCV